MIINKNSSSTEYLIEMQSLGDQLIMSRLEENVFNKMSLSEVDDMFRNWELTKQARKFHKDLRKRNEEREERMRIRAMKSKSIN